MTKFEELKLVYEMLLAEYDELSNAERDIKAKLRTLDERLDAVASSILLHKQTQSLS